MYYGVRELSKEMNMSRSSIHLLIEKGIINGCKDEEGFYQFDEEEMNRIRKIFYLNEKTYNCVEVAKLLGFNRPQTISDYCKKGLIKTYLLPTNRYVIPEKELKHIKKLMRLSTKNTLSGVLKERER